MDGCDLPLLVVDRLVQGLELLLDPLVPLLLGGELAAATLLGVQVRPLLRRLGQSAGGKDRVKGLGAKTILTPTAPLSVCGSVIY